MLYFLLFNILNIFNWFQHFHYFELNKLLLGLFIFFDRLCIIPLDQEVHKLSYFISCNCSVFNHNQKNWFYRNSKNYKHIWCKGKSDESDQNPCKHIFFFVCGYEICKEDCWVCHTGYEVLVVQMDSVLEPCFQRFVIPDIYRRGKICVHETLDLEKGQTRKKNKSYEYKPSCAKP